MVITLLLLASAPSMLACTIDNGGRQTAMTVRLNEARGAVRYAMPATSAPVKARAVFTSDRVMFDGFTLDRGSLAIVRDGDAVTAALGATPSLARGRCRAGGAVLRSVAPAKTGAAPGKRAR